MSAQHINKEWIPLQIKVFSRWVSSHLIEGKADVTVNDITKDLSNGVALVELAKILIGKDTPRNWVHAPKRNVDMVQNCDLSIEMFHKDGVHLVGISGKDIHDNNEKLILGYIWTLILKYSISTSISNDSDKANATATSSSASSKNSKDALMQWAIERTSNYPNIHNFQPYDLSMCALLDSYVPDKINYYQLDPKDSQHNAQLATNVMKEIGVPVYVYPDDCEGNHVDEKALLTQLSTAKVNLEKLPPPPPRVQERNVESTVSDFNQSTVVTEKVDVEGGEVIPDPNSIEQTNIESVVEDFNQSSQFNEEVIEDGLEADSALEGINAYSTRSVVNEESTDSDTDSEDIDVQSRSVQEPAFVAAPVAGDNSQYAGRKFGLVMTLNESDYSNGEKVDLTNDQLLFGEDIQLALTMVKDKKAYLNPAGLKLTIAEPNIENDVFQQFTFGKDEWNTVIDSVQQRGMVWDVADEFNLDPPSGTPFYLFPFHGRHNQHFVYKDNMIYAQQNGQVVTFVGGDEPLVMMPPSNQLRARQTFTLQLL